MLYSPLTTPVLTRPPSTDRLSPPLLFSFAVMAEQIYRFLFFQLLPFSASTQRPHDHSTSSLLPTARNHNAPQNTPTENTCRILPLLLLQLQPLYTYSLSRFFFLLLSSWSVLLATFILITLFIVLLFLSPLLREPPSPTVQNPQFRLLFLLGDRPSLCRDSPM